MNADAALGEQVTPIGEETSVLEVRNLTVEFQTAVGWRPAVQDVSFDIRRNEVYGLVGESGSGKSVTAMAILGLLPARGSRVTTSSSVSLGGTQIANRPSRQLDRVRGARVGMIFQEPMTSLNPAYTIGEQIAESVRKHRGASHKVAAAKAVDMLDRVGIPNATHAVSQYPHHFSGGMRQRAMIAMALACEPELLIADEPTTALDVTVQALILDLLADLRRDGNMSILLITHDLGVVAEVADRVGVLYAGEIVETDETEPLFARPRHPYTSGLLGSVLRIDDDAPLSTIQGSVPPITEDVNGCRFAARCSYVQEACTDRPIALRNDGTRLVRCRRAEELHLKGVR